MKWNIASAFQPVDVYKMIHCVLPAYAPSPNDVKTDFKHNFFSARAEHDQCLKVLVLVCAIPI